MEPTLSNVDIVVFALYKLGAASRKVYTEEIAWECYQMSPDRFSWRLPQFRERGFPDKDIVRVALTDAAKAKHGRLVRGRYGVEISGRGSDGWQLTPEGSNWSLQNEARLVRGLGKKAGVIPPIESKRLSKQIRKDPTFQAYMKDGIETVTKYMFTDFLGCTPDAPVDIVRNKYERVLSMATLAKDEQAVTFLRNCKEKFPQYFIEE